LNVAARRLSVATNATTRPEAIRGRPAWATSCRSIAGC
jgi:hypothetical protein